MRLERHEELLLLAHLTGRSRAELLLMEETEMPDETRRAFFDACERRRAGEPLQYILGEWDFYGLTFKTDARALIPRAETELLVEKVLAFCKNNFENIGSRKLRILDMCTGTGCIAITLAKQLLEKKTAENCTNVEIVAIDISEAALSLARENATLHSVREHVRFVRSDLANALLFAHDLNEDGLFVDGVSESCLPVNDLFVNEAQFDLIVSNPPYIPIIELDALQTEVRDYEPRLALDGGADGMDLYRRLLPQVYQLLRSGGGLFLEIGPRGVMDLVSAAGFRDVCLWPDYAGLDRMITAIK
ncbi:MAG: peptide chain release factor N(5)-glutamine methyltransferase [Defluviitaleaceae bacterium]|nr:peptide chain release factor N(5)-glutamine methyltransferase [Defluviitaleaceae bacterium]